MASQKNMPQQATLQLYLFKNLSLLAQCYLLNYTLDSCVYVCHIITILML